MALVWWPLGRFIRQGCVPKPVFAVLAHLVVFRLCGAWCPWRLSPHVNCHNRIALGNITIRSHEHQIMNSSVYMRSTGKQAAKLGHSCLTLLCVFALCRVCYFMAHMGRASSSPAHGQGSSPLSHRPGSSGPARPSTRSPKTPGHVLSIAPCVRQIAPLRHIALLRFSH